MLPTPSLTAECVEGLDRLLNRLVADKAVPSCSVAVANIEGVIYEHQAGTKIYGDEQSDEINKDTVFQLYSSTKLVTCVAALRLVDRGLLSLDDPDLIGQHVPELANLKILKDYKDAGLPEDQQQPGQEIWEEPRTRITLRMLMTHTSGLGYDTWSPLLPRYRKEHPQPPALAPGAGIPTYLLPLLFDPGSSWMYGVSIDWVGTLISRVTKQKLGTFFETEIFKPLGITSMTFLPTKDIKSRLAGWCLRDHFGQLHAQEGMPLGRAATAEETTDESGGIGLFGSLRDYVILLSAVLACSPQAAVEPKLRLISVESFDLLFQPSLPIPHSLRPAKDPRQPAVTEPSDALDRLTATVNDIFGWHPPVTPENMNHSVGFAIHTQDVPGGRSAGTGGWFGFMHTPAFIDPKMGIVAMVATQEINLAQPDISWPKILYDIESTVYAGLQM